MCQFTTDLKLKPQARRILAHLRSGKAITPVEAMTVYGIARLAASVYEIRRAGYDVGCERRRDEVGHGYGRYSIKGTRH